MHKDILYPALIVILAGFLFLASPLEAAGPDFEPGKWEITSKIDMPGMPQNTFTQTQCLSSDDYVPKGGNSQGAQDCRIEDVQTSGNTVTWTMRCTGQGQMTGKGKISYHGDTFEGTVEMTFPGGKMTQQMNGRRLGGCE